VALAFLRVVRGRLDERRFVAFYLNQDRIDAVVALNRGREVRRTMPPIKSRELVDLERLKDDDVDLRNLAPTYAAGGHS
jgi:3-phenylpropionate/trans-cinnamate dioxygenase ferredoxin reductase subunit